MEQRLKLGTQFPKLPSNTDGEILPTKGVYKTKYNTYQVKIYCPLDQKDLYLGSWKEPESAAQAYRYAKELINDSNGDAEKGKAKKVSNRAEKIATALAKEAESAKENSWEVNLINAIVKCSLFIKDYNNDDEDYSPVKEMVRYLC